VPEPLCPTSGGSSPKCGEKLANTAFFPVLQNPLGAALLKQIKSASNKGIQHYQHRFYATSWQDNTGVWGYLT
jgi:hypothetical protein